MAAALPLARGFFAGFSWGAGAATGCGSVASTLYWGFSSGGGGAGAGTGSVTGVSNLYGACARSVAARTAPSSGWFSDFLVPKILAKKLVKIIWCLLLVGYLAVDFGEQRFPNALTSTLLCVIISTYLENFYS
jgi:hypothetical protein